MIPQTLDGWTLEAIRELLARGVHENEFFDWKRELPHSKSEDDKHKLRKDCAAFANAHGGFLIFGVSDDREKPVEDRLVGIEPAFDFNPSFGSFPSECMPSVAWEPKREPVRLPSGRVLHVVHVRPSDGGPHMIEGRKGGVVFPKRTNKGNEEMSYEEIRLAFYPRCSGLGPPGYPR